MQVVLVLRVVLVTLHDLAATFPQQTGNVELCSLEVSIKCPPPPLLLLLPLPPPPPVQSRLSWGPDRCVSLTPEEAQTKGGGSRAVWLADL